MALSPREIVVGPLTIYVAPAVEAEDAISSTPSGAWTTLGSSGDANYGEGGISVSHSQTLRQTFAVGSTGPLKVNRQQEQLTVAFELMDFSLAQVTKILSNVAVSTATSPNVDYLGTRRGPDVAVVSLLCKGAGLSPSGDFPIQLYVPRAYMSGDLSPTFSKDDEARLQVEFTALEHASAATAAERFGRWVVQTS